MSLYKPAGSKKWVITYRDEDGRLRKKTAFTDKQKSRDLEQKLKEQVRMIRSGLTTRAEISATAQAKATVEEHIDRYRQSLLDEDATPKHADLVRRRLLKLFKLAGASTLREITLERTQTALARLREDGRGLKTLNHYGDTAKMFLDWCRKTHRIGRNPLRELKRYRAETDVRHERRSIAVEEFRRLLDVARTGPKYGRMTGELRELCYRVAYLTGLRFGEIKAMTPDWLDWKALTVTVPARVAKNRKLTTLPIDDGLAHALKARIATLEPGKPVFPMPKRGYAMLQVDLEAAGIPYEVNGKHFDFHALRGMTATVLDDIGTPAGVRRELMRHSSQAMTNLYTRPTDDRRREAVERLAETLSPGDGATESATDDDDPDDSGDGNPCGTGGCGVMVDASARVQFPPPPLQGPLEQTLRGVFHWTSVDFLLLRSIVETALGGMAEVAPIV